MKRRKLSAFEAGALILVAGETVDDLERARIAMENRCRDLTHPKGKGMGGTPEAERLTGVVAALHGLEKAAIRELEAAVKGAPLGDFIVNTPGLGAKTCGRLLALIGDPYWHPVHNRSRTFGELRKYCGLHNVPAGHIRFDTQDDNASGDFAQGHQCPVTQSSCSLRNGATPAKVDATNQIAYAGVAPTRRKGQKVDWNSKARMRLHNIAEGCIKAAGTEMTYITGPLAGKTVQGALSPYRTVYDAARAKYAEAVHTTPCVRCGPSGKPAPVGSPLSDGHKHGRAEKAVKVAVLRDLWAESKRIHDGAAAMAGSISKVRSPRSRRPTETTVVQDESAATVPPTPRAHAPRSRPVRRSA